MTREQARNTSYTEDNGDDLVVDVVYYDFEVVLKGREQEKPKENK